MIEGEVGAPILNAGAPVNGIDEVQTITVNGSPTGGDYTLKFEGFVTAAIAFDAAAATVQTALRALPSIGSGGCSVSGSAGGPYTVTFSGNRGKQAIGSLITLQNNGLTGGSSPTVAIAEGTAGVEATGRGAPKGTLLIDTTNGELYQNDGTALAPIWNPVGSRHIDVTLSSAEILALNATPITLIAAPGAGKALILEGLVIHKPAGTAYAGIAAGEDLAIKYTDGSGLEQGQVEMTGFADQTTAQTRFMRAHNAASGISSFTPVANAALVAHMLVGEITTGDSAFHLRLFYRIVPTVLP